MKILNIIYLFYIKTKFCVDKFDQMCRNFFVKLASRHWPMEVFYNIMDMIGVNAWILHKEKLRKHISRHDFLYQLAYDLRKDYKDSKSTSIASTSSEAEGKVNKK